MPTTQSLCAEAVRIAKSCWISINMTGLEIGLKIMSKNKIYDIQPCADISEQINQQNFERFS